MTDPVLVMHFGIKKNTFARYVPSCMVVVPAQSLRASWLVAVLLVVARGAGKFTRNKNPSEHSAKSLLDFVAFVWLWCNRDKKKWLQFFCSSLLLFFWTASGYQFILDFPAAPFFAFFYQSTSMFLCKCFHSKAKATVLCARTKRRGVAFCPCLAWFVLCICCFFVVSSDWRAFHSNTHKKKNQNVSLCYCSSVLPKPSILGHRISGVVRLFETEG